MSYPNPDCQTCASLSDESELVVARLAARMNCAFVCKECGREAQLNRQSATAPLIAENAALLAALEVAREALGIARCSLQPKTYDEDAEVADIIDAAVTRLTAALAQERAKENSDEA